MRYATFNLLRDDKRRIANLDEIRRTVEELAPDDYDRLGFYLPMRPAGTEGMHEDELAGLVSRDCLVGAALPRAPEP